MFAPIGPISGMRTAKDGDTRQPNIFSRPMIGASRVSS